MCMHYNAFLSDESPFMCLSINGNRLIEEITVFINITYMLKIFTQNLVFKW